jgi:nucleoside-diphosphate-sugar epimerase
MARVLITGASGFLGRATVAALAAQGDTLVGVGRRAPALPGLESALACDLLDPLAAKAAARTAGCEVLVHLAWADGPRDRWHGAANLDWTAATLCLAREFAAAGGRRMVFGSSCAVYDWSLGPVFDEAAPIAPRTLYGAAKAATAGLLVKAQPALGIGVAEARIFYCYGPGEPRGRLVSDLLAGLRDGRTVDCTDGLQRRDYLHSADVGSALAALAASDLTGPVNVGSGQPLAVADLVAEVARQAGRPDLLRMGAIARTADDPPEITAATRRLAQTQFRPRFGLIAGVASLFAGAS